MRAGAYLRQQLREARGGGGRVLFFVLSLAVGVAAVVAVASLGANLERALGSESRQLLAADLAVSASRPIPAEVARATDRPGVERAELVELSTVVASPASGHAQLVELKAVSPGYPFYGQPELQPARPLGELLANDGAVVGPALLPRLGVALGDPISIGGHRFTVRGVVVSEPDSIGGGFEIGPRVFVDRQALAATSLLGYGSRARYRLLVKLPGLAPREQVTAFAAEIRQAVPDPAFTRIETFAEGQPALKRGIQRAERFLGLVALLSLLVGGIGVAQTVRTWLAARLDAIAVWKALGARPREILAHYLGQIAALALLGSAVGAAVGAGLALGLPRLAADLLPKFVTVRLEPLALGRGLALGALVALLFALPPVLATRRVPAARVLRRAIEPIPASRWTLALTGLVLAAGIAALAVAQSRSPQLGLLFAAGLGTTAAILALAGWGLVALARRLPRESWPLVARHGLAALARPGAGTLGALVALGLGVLVVLAMFLVERGLSDQLRAELPTNAPTAFLIDIQPDQWGAVEKTALRLGATRIDSVPVVMARIAAIDGRSVGEIVGPVDAPGGDRRDDRRERRWALTREQRLTTLEKLPADNTIVAGKLWTARGVPEVSVEEEFAKDLNLHLGSKIRFDIQGVPVELEVTSLRKVQWETFGINFFLVAAPGVLDGAPQMRIAALRLPSGGEARLQDELVKDYPNVTVFPIRDVLEKVARVVRRIGVGVRFLGSFTVAAGIAILAGAVAATAARRGREVALLKALGMRRREVAAIFAFEYAALGLAAAAIGAVAALVLAREVLIAGMEVQWTVPWLPPLVAVAATIVLAVAAGLAASLRPLAQRPLEALRSES
ncbi:MAG: FtsX-like permease family protein [Thermoanaerobaculia bacterium]